MALLISVAMRTTMTTGRPHGRSRLDSDGKDASIGGVCPYGLPSYPGVEL